MAHKKGHGNWSDKSRAAKERVTGKLTNVYEGDRIEAAINTLASGGSDKKAKSYLKGEFPKGTLKIIKKELGYK